MTTGRQAGNPFDDPALASRYEQWYSDAGRDADLLEKDLLGKLLRGLPDARSVLEVGCGTGHFTRWLAESGLDAVGLDVSEPMLNEARRLGGPRYMSGDAHLLPFADRSYDVTALITTLEFLADPARALTEAVRVARQGVLLGGIESLEPVDAPLPPFRQADVARRPILWTLGTGRDGTAGGRGEGEGHNVAHHLVAHPGRARFAAALRRFHRDDSAIA